MISFSDTFGTRESPTKPLGVTTTTTRLIDKNLGFFERLNNASMAESDESKIHITSTNQESSPIKQVLLNNNQHNNSTLNSTQSIPGDQWWQLFDTQHKKFYYYNPQRQLCQWQRPNNNKQDNNQQVVVIPLALKLLDRLNTNLHVLRKSKRFLRLLKKKLDIDLQYDVSDLQIITGLTERLLSLQTILSPTSANTTALIMPSSSTSTFFDASDMDMVPTTNQKLGSTNPTTVSTSFSFGSGGEASNSSPATGTYKRRLQPRTNPNYVNVDYVNANNGSLQVKNTYIKLQDLTTGSSNLEQETPTTPTDINGNKKLTHLNSSSTSHGSNKTTFSTISQALLLLISLLNSTNKGKATPTEKSVAVMETKPKKQQPRTCLNRTVPPTVSCSTTRTIQPTYSNLNQRLADSISLNSSSATLISEQSLSCHTTTDNFNNNGPNNNNHLMNSSTTSRLAKKKEISSPSQHSNNGQFKTFYSASLSRKNMDKSRSQQQQKTDEALSPSRTNDTSKATNQNQVAKSKFSLFKRTTSSASWKENVDNESNGNHGDTRSQQETNITSHRKFSVHKGKNLFSFGASSSSLADIRNISNTGNHGNQQDSTSTAAGGSSVNQRLQTFKRSFNKKTSFKKIKSPDIVFGNSNNGSSSEEPCTPLGNKHQPQQLDLMNNSFDYSPATNKKGNLFLQQSQQQSQTNLLLLSSPFINLNTSAHSAQRRIRNGFLLFSGKKAKKTLAQNPSELLIWTDQSLQRPLIRTTDKTVKREACELFKLIQAYTGDRKLTSSHLPNIQDTPPLSQFGRQQIDAACATDNQLEHTKLYYRNLVCLEIMTKGWTYPALRDELYLQLVKQTTENPSHDSLMLGWDLVTIGLSFFPPSHKMFPFLTEYIFMHLDTSEINLPIPPNPATPTDSHGNEEPLCSTEPTAADTTYSLQLIETAKRMPRSETDRANQMAHACLKRLERIHLTGAKKGLKKPTLDEIFLSRQTVVSPSLFGSRLDEIMRVQATKCQQQLTLPWIQTALSEAVLRLDGARTEGIFRVPGDLDEVNSLKVRCDQLWCTQATLSPAVVAEDLVANVQDAHLPASLLKLWYRELQDPLIPNEFYEECIRNCDRPDTCVAIIQRLPTINRLVFTYLIRFLKVFAASDNVAITKMDASNLSMIMAPNCLRCQSNEPKVIMENTKKEMTFLNTLIHHLDTSSVQGL